MTKILKMFAYDRLTGTISFEEGKLKPSGPHAASILKFYREDFPEKNQEELLEIIKDRMNGTVKSAIIVEE